MAEDEADLPQKSNYTQREESPLDRQEGPRQHQEEGGLQKQNSYRLKRRKTQTRHQIALETLSIIDQEDLEINFQTEISSIQQTHFQVCKKLMQIYIIIMVPQMAFAFFQLSTCGCFESSPNDLICLIHYVKLVLNVFNIYKYYYNIRDYQPHHPIGSLNTFVMITFYYIMLFVKIRLLKEDASCVYLIGVYPVTDFGMVGLSLFMLKNVMRMKNELKSKQEYKNFAVEINQKLREVLYLPVAYESDVAEDKDD